MAVPDLDMVMENGASSLPMPLEEKKLVAELINEAESNLKEGNLYYVISNRWFSSWEKYVGQGNDEYLIDEISFNSQSSTVVPAKLSGRPGPIDNHDIVLNGSDCGADDLQLIRTLEEGRDYVLVPQQAWKKLFEWYKGGPALPRKLISQGVTSKKLNVEVYPLCLKLIDSRGNSQSTIRLSKKASVRELYERVCIHSGIDHEKARIWDYFNKKKHVILSDMDRTLEESNLQMDQDILLELHNDGYTSGFGMDSTGNELALVPLEPSRSSGTIAGGPTMCNGPSTGSSLDLYNGSSFTSGLKDTDNGYDISSSVRNGDRGGLAGLQNLGNTCFMNSSIQCLVHTPALVEYFLQDYSEDINTENPLGMHGELALAFGDLLRKLWSSGRTSVPPRAFKGKLARFAPQFSGYNQHDSQELLAFLLDGLHEDLNRVKQKPYIEAKDSDGRPDEEVAEECWKYHKARNDSLIVDVCQGQYKSTLVCPDCGKISITFDPFMYLSLPLPSITTRTMIVTIFHGDGSGLPMPYTVMVPKHGCMRDLTQALSAACCLKSDECLLLAEVYEHRIYRYLDIPMGSLSSIKDEEHIVAYRLQKKWTTKKRLEIIHRWQEKCATDSSKGGEMKLAGTPLVTYVEDSMSRADIEVAVSRMLSPLRRTYSSSSKRNSGKDNGISEAIENPTNIYGAHLSLRSQSNKNTELDDSFRLSITDEKGLSCKPFDKDFFSKPGRPVRIMLDWTSEQHELYDASYLKDLPEVHKTGFTAKKTRQDSITLFSCLEEFMKEEPLGPDDMWYCPGCKEHRQATKKLDLWRLPDILVFHLKRFSYSRYLKNKLDTFVNFPIHGLDLSKYVINKDGCSHVYELYAISNHYGGLGGGHYTAYAKLIDENRWYHFDDSHVSPVNEAEIKTSAAYVLFYRRVKSEQPRGSVCS